MTGRPGSKSYDNQRRRLRSLLEDDGKARDKEADERANEILQHDRGRTGVLRGDRGRGPKAERMPGEDR
ncbi:phosphatidylethanolamine-binding protein [Rhizomonospora bruguierae]|uniref:phosphatidylethanolamine-binding protein n=1 Tax=Rhizomonospora bruguierae TaxID=1581705 RepID=UPI001BCF4983|nr:phosphatidylethanolamine-binding protein [Micromonospora sp. NBRC 107566]